MTRKKPDAAAARRRSRSRLRRQIAREVRELLQAAAPRWLGAAGPSRTSPHAGLVRANAL